MATLAAQKVLSLKDNIFVPPIEKIAKVLKLEAGDSDLYVISFYYLILPKISPLPSKRKV